MTKALICTRKQKPWRILVAVAKWRHRENGLLPTCIECFHMTSRRPCWCPKPVLWELNSFLMQTLSFVSIHLHRCWSLEWKHSIRDIGVEFVYSIKTTRRFNSHAKYIVRFDKNYVIVYSSRVGQIFTIPCNLIFKRSVDLVWLWCLGCAILPFFSRAHTDVAPADTWYRWGGFSLMWNHLVPVQGERREEQYNLDDIPIEMQQLWESHQHENSTHVNANPIESENKTLLGKDFKTLSWLKTVWIVGQIGHFQVSPSLCFKARLSSKLLIWKWFFYSPVSLSQERFYS